MRRLLRPFLCASLLAALPTGLVLAGEPVVAAPPAATPADGIRRLKDLEYGRVGETRLLLDLYLPADAKEPVPLVLWVHGGAWVSGSKAFCPLLKLVPKGYAVASVGYRLATVAFVGGSVADTGGHNPIEPAAAGVPVTFGPFMSNFREIASVFLEREAAIEVADAKALADLVIRLCRDAAMRDEYAHRARGVIDANRGAADRIADRVVAMMEG